MDPMNPSGTSIKPFQACPPTPNTAPPGSPGGVFTDTNHSGPQTFPALTPGIPGFSVFFLKPGPFPIACSWNSRYLFELIYISSDFDHGDVIKATASYRYVGGFQKVAFFNKKSTSTMVKWHFQGPCFFLISSCGENLVKVLTFLELGFSSHPKKFEPIELRI